MRQPLIIAPSILAADFARLGDDVISIAQAGADWIHIDVMDGHFVPNLSFGAPIISAIRPVTTLPFDVHLMITPVDRYLAQFAAAGADRLTFHAEATPDIGVTIAAIKALGKRVGLAVKPATPIDVLAPFIDQLDLVLVMTVEPGFGGQAYMPAMTAKIAAARALIGSRPIRLQVDGGIGLSTRATVMNAGADALVAGSALFQSADRAAAIAALRG
jgi:ribulose-phosphate 3-epimerase